MPDIYEARSCRAAEETTRFHNRHSGAQLGGTYGSKDASATSANDTDVKIASHWNRVCFLVHGIHRMRCSLVHTTW